MAVVGIMGLLAVVGVPALKGLAGSGGRKQALSQVLGAMEVARNTAISTGTNAAVIFPDSSFDQGQAYRYRSMAVVSWFTDSQGKVTNKMVGSWIVLPQGTAFFPKSLATTNLVLATNVTYRILTSTRTGNFPAIMFQGDGALAEDPLNTASKFPTNGIAFFEGTVSGDTANKMYPKLTNFETVRVSRYSGRAQATLAPEP